jgi:nucleotide-binding universal stress UspA family protein
MSASAQTFSLFVVGVDGSVGSRRALAWSADLAEATEATILAVHVLTYNREFFRDLTLDTIRAWRRELEADLRTHWVEPLISRGIQHRCVIVEANSPAEGLLAVSDREGAGLLIVGAKGHGGIADRVLGGVSHRVAHLARQPVVVVPPDWAPRRAA